MGLESIRGVSDVKKFIAGIIVGVALMLATSAHAELFTVVGKVVEGEVNVRFDGTEMDKSAIIVDGSSYLPVRSLADAFDAEVSFDSRSGIDLFSRKDVKTEMINSTNAVNPKAKIEREWEHYFLKRRFAVSNLQRAKTDEARAQFQAEINEIDNELAKLAVEKEAMEAKMNEAPD